MCKSVMLDNLTSRKVISTSFPLIQSALRILPLSLHPTIFSYSLCKLPFCGSLVSGWEECSTRQSVFHNLLLSDPEIIGDPITEDHDGE